MAIYWKQELEINNLVFRYSDGAGNPRQGELERVVEDLAQGMPEYNPTQYFARQPNIFNNYAHVVTAVEQRSGKTIGLLGSKWFTSNDFSCLYLWTGMVADRAQKQNLTMMMFYLVLEKALSERALPPVIAAKTFSPIWYKVMKRITDFIPSAELYPRIGILPQRPKMVALARQTHHLLCPTLELKENVGVVLGGQSAVGPDFFPISRPCSGDAILDEYFAGNLTTDDQVLTVIDVSRASRQEVERVLLEARKVAFGDARFRQLVSESVA